MALLAAVGVGALVGAAAGLTVHGVKCAVSSKHDWHWKDAVAHGAGGLVGGAAFPLLMTGLGAAGVPGAAAYVASGGLAWGGIWSLSQDATSVALGRSESLQSVKDYLISTAIGAGISAVLLPVAGFSFQGGALKPHSGSPQDFIRPGNSANVLKAEGEFLAFGAAAEGIGAVSRSAAADAAEAQLTDLALSSGVEASLGQLVLPFFASLGERMQRERPSEPAQDPSALAPVRGAPPRAESRLEEEEEEAAAALEAVIARAGGVSLDGAAAPVGSTTAVSSGFLGHLRGRETGRAGP